MRVVAAGVHPAGNPRGKGFSAALGHGQRVHIRPQQYPGRAAAAKLGQYPALRQGTAGNLKLPQRLHNMRRGQGQVKAQLRIFMKQAPLPGDPAAKRSCPLKVVGHFFSITSMMQSLVFFIPSRAISETLLIEFSTPFFTMPSPP